MIKLQGKSQIINHDEKLQVWPASQVTFVDGKPVHDNVIAHTIDCNVQPLNDRDLLLVPELDRTKEQFWVFTNPESAIQLNDRVMRNSINYQVQGLSNWGSYARARIVKVDVGPDAS